MKILILVFGVSILFTVPSIAETIVVDPNGSADFTTIQEAINSSWPGDTVIVRPGTYNGSGGQIYFNYSAITLTSTNPDDTTVVESTIINADINFYSGEGADSIITGFTLNSIYGAAGATPTITKNIINNSIVHCNGLIANNTITSYFIYCNALISNNAIIEGGRAFYRCDAVVTQNKIHNRTISGGSASDPYGIFDECPSILIEGNIISGNSAEGSYDGIITECNGAYVHNNTIVYNRGYIFNYSDGIVAKNNIFAFNEHVSGMSDRSYNCFWPTGGTASQGTGNIIRDPLFVNEGYWDNNGTPEDISDDTWIAGDYHLKSEIGRWNPNTETWVLDVTTSRCIDAGDPCDLIGVELNPNGGRINQGAYGGTIEASKSPSGIIESLCTEYPTMDFNKDCKVNLTDFSIFVQSWLDCNLDPPEACWE